MFINSAAFLYWIEKGGSYMEDVFAEYGVWDLYLRDRYPLEESGILKEAEEDELIGFFETFEYESYEQFSTLFPLYLFLRKKNRQF